MGNKPLRIKTDEKAAAAPFIQSMQLGTTSYPSSWLPLRKIRPGAEPAFTLGSTPSSWAAAKALAPPSWVRAGTHSEGGAWPMLARISSVASQSLACIAATTVSPRTHHARKGPLKSPWVTTRS